LERLADWYVAASRHVEVDGLLADGTDGNSCRFCQARARQLVKASRRAALAAELETLIELAGEESQRGRSQTPLSIMDLRVAAVRTARRELLELAHALRSAERPEARGVALAMLLVRHGQSPLYVDYGPDDVALAAKVAMTALTGSPGSRHSAGRASCPSASGGQLTAEFALPRWWAGSKS